MRRRGLFGPFLLVLIGTALLASNLIPDWSVGAAFAEHWPWLLVIWGGTHLLEQALSPSLGWRRPRPLGGGAVVLALLLAIAGTAARQARSADFGFIRPWDRDWFHEEKHSFPVELEAAAAAVLRLDGLRGELEIRGDQEATGIAVTGEMLLTGNDQAAAERRVETARLELVEEAGDSRLTLRAADRVGAAPGREYRITVTVPRRTAIDAKNVAGRLSIADVEGDVAIEGRGHVRTEGIGGAVAIDLEHGKRIEVLRASSLELKGSADHLDVRAVSGGVKIDGNLFRDAYLAELDGPVELISRRTRLQATKLAGSVEIERERLIAKRVQEMQLETKGSRRIEVLGPVGKTSAFAERGKLIVEPGAESGETEIRGLRADVEARIAKDLTLSIDAEAKRGEVRTFLEETDDANATGGVRLRLESEGGDVEIRPAKPREVEERF